MKLNHDFVRRCNAKLLLSSLLGFTTLVRAQQYSIDAFTIAGGSGTITGGIYSLSGAAGQPDGNLELSGGAFSMTGGFWSIIAGATPAVTPATIFDNTGGSENGYEAATTNAWLANKFCLGPQTYQLDSVSLLLNTQDSSGQPGPPSTVRLQIYSNDPVSGKPSASTGLIMNLSGLTNPITLLTGQQFANGSTPIPGGTGNFTSLPLAPGLSGSSLVFYGAGSSGQQGIYLTTRGLLQAPTRIADLNTAIPNGAGNFLSFGTEAGIIIVGGDILFSGRGAGSQQGIYLSSHATPGALVRIADTATAIPGGVGTFMGFQNALGFSGSDVAFVGSGSGGQQGIYGASVAASGPPYKVADTATAIPGGSGNFAGFSAVSVSDTEVAFLGHGSSGQTGIYDMAGGQLRKVISVGETILGKTIAGLNFTRSGLFGDPIAFQAAFTDGSQGVYTIDVPAPPAELRIFAAERSGADLRLSFTSVAGQKYAIQSRADLSSGTWTTLPGAPTSGDGVTVEVTLPNALVQPQQFYRVKIVP